MALRLGFLGLGTIATAVVKGIADKQNAITVSVRNTRRSTVLAKSYPNVRVAQNQSVVDVSDVIFLGCTAEAAAGMLQPLRFKARQKIVSFMNGISAEDIKALIKPATFETTMIPFPSIAHGGSPILVYPESSLIRQLFGESNTMIPLNSRSDFNQFMAAQAVLSPIVKILSTGVDWLSERIEDPHQAEQFLRLLVGGSILAEPITEPKALATLLDSLNTPGGLNAQLREYMAKRNTYTHLQLGLEQLEKRLSSDS